ncbi:MAG: ABC transporter permease, partial [Promethearchaeota archaeon]
HLCLPVFCLSFVSLASITRQTRSSMLEVLEQDFVRTARAKGCVEKSVIHSHALRNALIPTVTVIGLSIAGLLGGAVLTETTFGLNGIGKLFIDSILLYDYWVLSALVFLITIIFVVANLLTDVIYAILDPRIRYA